MASQTAGQQHPTAKSWVALLFVYIFWGTTYLGIRMALESFSPLLLMGLRFMISGTVLLIGGRLLGMQIPSGKDLRHTAIFGLLTLGIGNGCLTLAELWVPSGLAALLITTSPFWMLTIDSLVPGGDRFYKPVLWGMFIGLTGTVLLLLPIGGGSGNQATSAAAGTGKVLLGFLVLQFGNWGWCLGSILQRRHASQCHPVMSGAVQQMAVGLICIVPGLVTNGAQAHWTAKGLGAVFYLATVGSIIGYSAYLYAMDTLPVSIVSTYSYVNPVVAVLLGWLFYSEPLGIRELAAMAAIFAGVAVVRKMQARGAAAAAAATVSPLPAPETAET